MSADVFAPAVFPRLRDTALDAERDRARRRGYADGHAEGFRAAAEAASATAAEAEARRAAREAELRGAVAQAVATLQTAAAALTVRACELAATAQDRVHAHAVELAAVILAGELAVGETAATSAVRRALAAADDADVREVRLNAADLAVLERLGVQPEGVALVADDELARGDAVAILDDGFVDARIGAAVERARQAVAEATP
jgi:flagellar assembly protein FliH